MQRFPGKNTLPPPPPHKKKPAVKNASGSGRRKWPTKIKRKQKGSFVKGWFTRMCPRSGFWYRRSILCTLVPVFFGGPSFLFFIRSFRLLVPRNICENHPFGNHPFSEGTITRVSRNPTFAQKKRGALSGGFLLIFLCLRPKRAPKESAPNPYCQ